MIVIEDKNIVEVLLERRRDSAEKQAFICLQNGEDESGQLSYLELYHRINTIAAHLLDRVNPGESVLLAYPSGLEFVCAFFACLRANIIAVPIPVPRSRRSLSRIETIANESRCAFLLTDT